MGLAVLELQVELLLLGNGLEKLVDLMVLDLELALLKGSHLPLLLGLDLSSRANEFFEFLEVVELLLEIVNLLKQVNVLLHETFVDLIVRFICLSLGISKVVNVRLQVLSDLLELKSAIVIILLLVLFLLGDV